MKSNKDSKLIRKLNSGNKQVFENIYEVYHKPVYLFAIKILSDKHEAEDITANIFAKLWEKATKGELDSLTNVKGYLFISVRNACFDHIKSVRRKTFLQIDDPSQVNHHDSPPHHEITAESIDLACKHVKTLPEKRGAIIKIILREGYTDAQVAQYLNISPKTVRNQKNTAIQDLRENLTLIADITNGRY